MATTVAEVDELVPSALVYSNLRVSTIRRPLGIPRISMPPPQGVMDPLPVMAAEA